MFLFFKCNLPSSLISKKEREHRFEQEQKEQRLEMGQIEKKHRFIEMELKMKELELEEEHLLKIDKITKSEQSGNHNWSILCPLCRTSMNEDILNTRICEVCFNNCANSWVNEP